MTPPSRYSYEIDPEDDSAHSRILRIVGTAGRVLELGCGPAKMTEFLVGVGNEVTALDIDAESVEMAAAFTADAFQADLDQIDLRHRLQEQSYDVAIAADVLEHLRHPARTLRQAAELVRPGGRVVASIPNVGHIDVRMALLAGQWEYRPTGLLDATHLRFFTRETVLRLFAAVGLDVIDVQTVTWAPFTTNVGGHPASLPIELVQELASQPDADTLQFVVTAAVPDAGLPPADDDALDAALSRRVPYAEHAETYRGLADHAGRAAAQEEHPVPPPPAAEAASETSSRSRGVTRSMKKAVIDRLGISRVARTADIAAATAATTAEEVDALRRQVTALGERLGQLGAEAQLLRAEADLLREEAARTRSHGADTAEIVQRLQSWQRINLSSFVAEGAPATPGVRITVLMATRNRATLLPHAINSVRAQSHLDWQLVVVDDGSTDETPDVLASFSDERITLLRTEGVGVSAARNLGLQHVEGEWVTFLDDDNTMAPGWLHAVAAFAARVPEATVMFGAQIRQMLPDAGPTPFDAELLFVDPIDPETLRGTNTVDLGALAVRRGTPGLEFDESLRRFVDWELVRRLVATNSVHAVPVLSSIYLTEAPHRVSDVGGDAAVADFLRRPMPAPMPAPAPAPEQP